MLHALWNVALKSKGDPVIGLAIVLGVGAVVVFPFAILLPTMDRAGWDWLMPSLGVHFAYHIALTRIYSEASLAEAYPMTRGLGPVLVTAASSIIAKEVPSAVTLLGIFFVSAGVVSMRRPRTAQSTGGGRRLVTLAVIAASLMAGCHVLDGLGARASKHPITYACWIQSLEAIGFVAYVLYTRRAQLRALDRSFVIRNAVAGLFANAGYSIVLWAMSQATLGAVAALRESSIVFVVIFSRLLLKEPIDKRRATCALIIACGAALVAASARARVPMDRGHKTPGLQAHVERAHEVCAGLRTFARD